MRPDPAEAQPQTPLNRLRLTFAAAGWGAVVLGCIVLLSVAGLAPAEFSYAVPAVAVGAPALVLASLAGPGMTRARLLGLTAIGLGAWIILALDLRTVMMVRASFQSGSEFEVSIAELNVWDFNPEPAETIRWLKETDADIFVLVEARESFMRDLMQAVPDYPTVVTCASRPYCGVAIVSRFEGRLLDGGAWQSGDLSRPHATGNEIATAAVELLVPGKGGPGRTLKIVGVHLDREGLSRVAHDDIEQLLQQVDAVAETPADALVVAGDFNASPWSPELRHFVTMSGLSRTSVWAPTWPSFDGPFLSGLPTLMLAVDGVHAGCGVTLGAIETGPHVGSDHRSLLARIMLTEVDEGCRVMGVHRARRASESSPGSPAAATVRRAVSKRGRDS
ncbi:MAG: endonuclease/exonuclease/phosphatase family protein [Alphaproteobacteria bacterium]|nr:endonuclease/exonuclease/phosphatase family protein [Alphaproteobacteria bacterium]